MSAPSISNPFFFVLAEPENVQFKRNAFRATLPGLTAAMNDDYDTRYKVDDISAGGLSFDIPDSSLARGDEVTLHLFLADRLISTEIPARVMRVEPGQIGLAFKTLDRQQELRIDKIVLETQKRAIIREKIERENQERTELLGKQY